MLPSVPVRFAQRFWLCEGVGLLLLQIAEDPVQSKLILLLMVGVSEAVGFLPVSGLPGLSVLIPFPGRRKDFMPEVLDSKDELPEGFFVVLDSRQPLPGRIVFREVLWGSRVVSHQLHGVPGHRLLPVGVVGGRVFVKYGVNDRRESPEEEVMLSHVPQRFSFPGVLSVPGGSRFCDACVIGVDCGTKSHFAAPGGYFTSVVFVLLLGTLYWCVGST